MKKQITSRRLTTNLRQFKKYVDEALEKGAEEIFIDNDRDNPYINFCAYLTPEEENEVEIRELTENYNKKLAQLKDNKYKTYLFRITAGQCQHDIHELINDFKEKNNIMDPIMFDYRAVINDDYDDFADGMNTVFVTEILTL